MFTAMDTLLKGWQRITSENTPLVIQRKLNSYRRINKFLEQTNELLAIGQVIIGHAETAKLHKQKFFKRFLFPFNVIIYFAYLSTHRFFPKLNRFTASVYFHLSGGRDRVLSKAEVLGRICSCGFSITECHENNGIIMFRATKTARPSYNMKPSYWPMFRMNRVGKHGKLIGVYKFRTMHPYSEYLQQFLLKENGLDKGGKFKSDFRITSWGKVLRRYWLDELPMMINLFKGDLKLIGVRPLSQQYYNMYSQELQMLRLMTKPGLIPPFYADMPSTLEEIMESEKKYLQAYYKAPLMTDIKYFTKSVFNILFKKARSK
jgi:lipopolysaccharide/colanic/teichoic acid biosynthesis glycosyltransferase